MSWPEAVAVSVSVASFCAMFAFGLRMPKVIVQYRDKPLNTSRARPQRDTTWLWTEKDLQNKPKQEADRGMRPAKDAHRPSGSIANPANQQEAADGEAN